MRGLQGDFSTMPLADLVVYLGKKKVTGRLRLDRGNINKEVSIKNGLVINAGSNDPREYLGQFLINMGHITEEQFLRAFETQKETKVYLGKILTLIGLVSEEVVTTALALKFRETLLEAFHWNDGNFNFDASAAPDIPQGIDVKLDLLDIHREGEFRETAWKAIRSVFPSGKARLEVVEEHLPEPPKPNSLDERLVALIKAGHAIDEIILALHATDFFVYQRLFALYRLDAVRVADTISVEIDDEPLSSPETPLPTAAELFDQASAKLASGDYVAAEVLARKSQELAATPQTAELLRKAELGLTAQLRQELSGTGRVPSLLVAPSELRTLALTAPERYLLSRIDGQRNVTSIVQVSPLRELDALRFFQRFINNGLIKVSD